uniref:Helicase ARIP4 n=1 Tax=Glossina austeni TaxID=7395 RepID=A0A1A9V6H7_GLOAU
MDTQSELNYLANMKPPDTFGHPKYPPYDSLNRPSTEMATQLMPTQPLVTHVEHIPPPPTALAGNNLPFAPLMPMASATVPLTPTLDSLANNSSVDTCNQHVDNENINNDCNNINPSNPEAQKRKSSTETQSDLNQLLQKREKTVLPPIDEKKKRKNIRDVMDTNQLDTNTLKAQHEESERLARMAEQQKLLREYQQREAVLTHFDRFVNEHRVKNPEDLLELSGSPKSSVLEDDSKQSQITTETETQDVRDDDEKTKAPAEVVTIEDSSSDDDCIVLSDDEEDVEEDMDDPENSGLHVKDEFNIPDHIGRVVINVGHPDSEEDIFIAPQIARTIKPHQIGGIRFLFDNVIESTTRFKTSGGFGCILAHSMGLGKTLQVVCFCDIFLRYTPSKYVVCVMPINTLQNWNAEFDMWIPKMSENPEYVRPRNFDVFVLNDQHKTFSARARIILQWREQGGVLLIGYELFRLMALKLSTTGKRRSKKSQLRNDELDESHHRLMDEIYEALVRPGPDLVICDEGHRIKNSQAGISQALKQIRTRRRIVLTGYPLQNNLVEYWCMVDFVRPNYLGTKTEFCNMFERPIQNGLCVDSTPDDIKLMRYRAHVLHSLLVGFVQRRSHTVLQQSLPEKQEFVILTRMTDLQRQLYDTFMNDIVRTKNVPNPLKAFAVCCKIWNHPDVLYDAIKVAEYGFDLDIEEVEEIAPNISNINKDGFPPPIPVPPPPLLATQLSTINAFDKSVNSIQQMPAVPLQNTTAPSLNSVTSVHNITSNSHAGGNLLQNSNYNNINCNNITGTQNPTTAINATSNAMNYQSANTLYGDLNQYDNSSFNTTPNHSTYPQDLQSSYFPYSSMLSSMGSPLKPNYVGCMVKQPVADNMPTEENHNSSSEIVDLDTKEIKTIETDIDMDKNISMNKDELQKPVNAVDVEAKSEIDITTTGLTSVLENNEGEQRRGCDKITYDWASKLIKKYEPGLITNSPKMEIFFCILNESIRIGDRVLLFSQSLLTLNLIEKFLQVNQVPGTDFCWTFGRNYFRLDGSTTSQERERLVNEFNLNTNVKLFLISTKAGSLGINLVGANRVIIFDASWNPCHDTQAIYRIYRYGQKRSCYIYRIVMDKCLEKKIYDRQIKKQGMSDRVVDECNPDNHLSIKDVTNLCYDYDDDEDKSNAVEFQKPLDSYTDVIMRKILEEYKALLTKEPFFHESLLVDRKNDKLSQAEKRLAHRSYEMQKKTSSKQTFISTGSRVQFQTIRKDGALITKPIASVRPMQAPRSQTTQKYSSGLRSTRWIPAEVWQKQGMTAQEMSLPLDVVIPTNSSNKSKIVIKAGQRVMVLKSAKGIYMQLDSGKIIAIRTMNKPNVISKGDKPDVIDITGETETATNDSKTDKAETETTNSSFTDSSMDVDSSTSTSSGLQKSVKMEIDKNTEESLKTTTTENPTQSQFNNNHLALFNNTTNTNNTSNISTNANHFKNNNHNNILNSMKTENANQQHQRGQTHQHLSNADNRQQTHLNTQQHPMQQHQSSQPQHQPQHLALNQTHNEIKQSNEAHSAHAGAHSLHQHTTSAYGTAGHHTSHQHHAHHPQAFYAQTHAYATSQGHHSQTQNLRNAHHYSAHTRSSDISPYTTYSTAQYTDFPTYASHESLTQQNTRYHPTGGSHNNLSQPHPSALTDFYASYYPQWSPFMLPPPPPTTKAAVTPHPATNASDTNHLMHHSYPSAHTHSSHSMSKVQTTNNAGNQWQQYQ